MFWHEVSLIRKSSMYTWVNPQSTQTNISWLWILQIDTMTYDDINNSQQLTHCLNTHMFRNSYFGSLPQDCLVAVISQDMKLIHRTNVLVVSCFVNWMRYIHSTCFRINYDYTSFLIGFCCWFKVSMLYFVYFCLSCRYILSFGQAHYMHNETFIVFI